MSFRFSLSPVDPNTPVALPTPWPTLTSDGFHPDLVLRARGFMLAAERMGFPEPAREVLAVLGEGFRTPFSKERFSPAADDADREMKEGVLTAITKLQEEFGDRISSSIWNSLACLGTRPNPREEAMIPDIQEHLPYPYWIVDTVLHAIGKVYRLKHHIDSVIYAHSGLVLDHNCDCSHSFYPADADGGIKCTLPRKNLEVATNALFSHTCCEALLIGALKLPFEMGVSPEAAAAIR
jgi:hypothetical protein